MASLTRWVLAHKRIVVDLLGRADARRHGLGGLRRPKRSNRNSPCPARKAGSPTSRSRATSTAPAATTRRCCPSSRSRPDSRSTRRACSANCARVEARLQRALPGQPRRRLRDDQEPRASSPRTAARRSSSPTRAPDPKEAVRQQPRSGRKRPRARSKGATVAGAPVHVTGFDALSVQSGGGERPRRARRGAARRRRRAARARASCSRSFLALVPIMMAIVSILTTFLVVWGLTTITEVSPIVQFLIALIGLGVSIDYALIVVVRWREERAHGLQRRRGDRARDGDRRARRRVQRHDRRDRPARARRAAAAVPALGRLRRHADPADQRARRGHAAARRAAASSARAWTGRTCATTTRPAAPGPAGRTSSCAGAGSPRSAPRVVLVALVVAATNLQLGLANLNTIAKQGDAKQGLVALERSGIGSGALLPHEALVEGATLAGDGRRARSPPCPACTAPSRPARRNGAATARPSSTRSQTPDGSSPAGRDVLDRVRAVAHELGDGVRLGGLRRAEPRLHRSRLRQLPADDRADRASSRSSCSRAPSARCCCR